MAAVTVMTSPVTCLAACSGGADSASGGRVATALPSPGSSDHHSETGRSADAQSSTPAFHQVDVFYLGAGPEGPVLFRQATLVVPGVDRMETATEALVETPDQPAYHTVWRPGWLTGASTSGDHIVVDADGAPTSRPPGMDAATATASVQQVVYTLQAASGTHDPVEFTRSGRPASSVLGVPTGTPVRAAPLAHTVSLVTIDDGTLDGTFLRRGRIPVTGLADTADGAIEVRIERDGRTVRSKAGRASGWGSPVRLYPWRVVIDTTGLPNGRYQVVASGPVPADPSLTATDERTLRLGGHH
jgi:hypothetical protein